MTSNQYVQNKVQRTYDWLLTKDTKFVEDHLRSLVSNKVKKQFPDHYQLIISELELAFIRLKIERRHKFSDFKPISLYILNFVYDKTAFESKVQTIIESAEAVPAEISEEQNDDEIKCEDEHLQREGESFIKAGDQSEVEQPTDDQKSEDILEQGISVVSTDEKSAEVSCIESQVVPSLPTIDRAKISISRKILQQFRENIKEPKSLSILTIAQVDGEQVVPEITVDAQPIVLQESILPVWDRIASADSVSGLLADGKSHGYATTDGKSHGYTTTDVSWTVFCCVGKDADTFRGGGLESCIVRAVVIHLCSTAMVMTAAFLVNSVAVCQVLGVSELKRSMISGGVSGRVQSWSDFARVMVGV